MDSNLRAPSLDWIEVRLLVPQGWQELVADALEVGETASVVFGATSIGMEEPPEGMELVRSYLPAREDSEEARAALQARLDALAESAGAPELANLRAEFRSLPREDFARSWRKSWRPFRVHSLCVIPPWYEGETRPTDRRMILEPGGSFGSGRHATTRTCLKVLQERLRGGERVLDAGSGSGILSVAAAILGAGACLGYDIDPNSAAYGEALARQNQVGKRTQFRLGDAAVLKDEECGFDVVLANIYSDVIQAEAADFARRLDGAGWFAFSGCPAHHRAETRAAIEAAGLAIEEERTRGRWTTFVGTHAR